MAGQTCDMDALAAIAERHGLPIFEDAAHAMGATHGGRKVGQLSTAAAFSFYPTKNMTTVEGGLLVTDDAIADRARVLSLHCSPTTATWSA
jgi:dTDP-4-amino-4,6-dideoxygalactose transaminase